MKSSKQRVYMVCSSLAYYICSGQHINIKVWSWDSNELLVNMEGSFSTA